MRSRQPNRRRGRPPLLNAVKRREICAIVACGGTRTFAGHYVGCSLDTIARAAERDPEFAARLRRAELGKRVGRLAPENSPLTAALAEMARIILSGEK